MRTPAGTGCTYYYEDFHRGREIQECRARISGSSRPWTVSDCESCSVPTILASNGDQALQLTLTFRTGLLGRRKPPHVEAWCSRHAVQVPDPSHGCPECDKVARRLLEGDPDV